MVKACKWIKRNTSKAEVQQNLCLFSKKSFTTTSNPSHCFAYQPFQNHSAPPAIALPQQGSQLFQSGNNHLKTKRIDPDCFSLLFCAITADDDDDDDDDDGTDRPTVAATVRPSPARISLGNEPKRKIPNRNGLMCVRAGR